MTEFLKSFWELIKLYWEISPLGTILLVPSCLLVIYVPYGIFKKATEPDKPSEFPTHFIIKIEDHSVKSEEHSQESE